MALVFFIEESLRHFFVPHKPRNFACVTLESGVGHVAPNLETVGQLNYDYNHGGECTYFLNFERSSTVEEGLHLDVRTESLFVPEHPLIEDHYLMTSSMR